MTNDNGQPSLLQKIWKFLQNASVAIVGVVLILALIWALPFLTNKNPVNYANIEDHFKYGSIGGEDSDGIPYWIWKALPVVFSDKLPAAGLTGFGFIQEAEHELPIGFAKSPNFLGLDVVTQNCATCHVGSLRDQPDSEPRIISAMPSNTVNLQGYIQFLADVAIDKRFTANELMPYINEMGANFNPLQKLVYRYITIPQTRDGLVRLREGFAFMERQSPYGPGRVDTFTSYKSRRFNFPTDSLEEDELNGIADLPSIWNQKPREGMQLHWDGNNTSIDERNKSAALALVQPTTINLDSIHRIRDWLMELPAPSYPYPINQELAAVGQPIYENTCASCHAFGGSKVGKVVPIEEIGTDPGRLDSYTYELASNQYTLFTGISYQGEDQRFTKFRKTNGYANHPLDGIWLRSPYLHNGSVPTLRDLLEAPDKRPKTFYRGYDVYDPENVGFVSDVAEENGKAYFKFDTTKPGNSNSGHTYGIDLSPDEKEALVEYMKTL